MIKFNKPKTLIELLHDGLLFAPNQLLYMSPDSVDEDWMGSSLSQHVSDGGYSDVSEIISDFAELESKLNDVKILAVSLFDKVNACEHTDMYKSEPYQLGGPYSPVYEDRHCTKCSYKKRVMILEGD